MIQYQDHQQEVKLALQVTILLLLKDIKHSAIAMAPRKETWSHTIILMYFRMVSHHLFADGETS